MSNRRKPSDLEFWVHEELRKLPDIQAPSDLTGRVWARLRAQALPWWQCSWWYWPRTVQLTAAVPFLGMALLLALGPWLAEPILPGSRLVLAPLWERALDLSGVLLAVGRAGALVVQTLTGSQWLWIASGVGLVSYLWCIGLGTCLVRLARRQAAGSGGRG